MTSIGTIFICFLCIWKKPVIGVYISLSLLALGELWRVVLPVFDTPILFLDLFVFLFGILYLVKRRLENRPIRVGRLFLPFCVFFLIAFCSLIIQYPDLGPANATIGFFYLVRLTGYFGLYIIALNELRLRRGVIILLLVTVVLSLEGFIQLIILPDFTFMYNYGYDPHMGRLLASWFDPNFLGGFFAGTITFFLNLLFYREMKGGQWWMTIFSVLLCLMACLLTYSRSAYLALVIGILLTGIFHSPKILISLLFLLLVITLLIPRVKERVGDLYGSVLASVTQSLDYSLDETAQLRVRSWQQGMELFWQSPWWGIGYGTMRYAKLNSGMITDPDIHSGSGSDSSLLTILASTGLIGFGCFLWILVTMLSVSFSIFQDNRARMFARYCGIGFFLTLIALLTHSFFVNSLLSPYFLVFLFTLFGSVEGYEGIKKSCPWDKIHYS